MSFTVVNISHAASHPQCSVWAITGPASSSDVTVIDPARSNTILDQFSLPPTSPALCICAVPPTGQSELCSFVEFTQVFTAGSVMIV